MDIVVKHGQKLMGRVKVPPSKSHSQRAIAASLLLDTSHIENRGFSDDENACVEILRSIGCEVNEQGQELYIQNRFQFDKNVHIDCHESGFCARLFAAFMMFNTAETHIVGRGTLLQRPMTPIQSIYDQLGICYTWNQGLLPITIRGNRVQKDLEIDGSLSSQFISGILYYLVGQELKKTIRLTVHNPKSVPYINMTISFLNSLGADIYWKTVNVLEIHSSILKKNAEIVVEGCWSSASFWLVAAAINGEITLEGLDPSSEQADRAVLNVLTDFGAEVEITESRVFVKSSENKPFRFDATDCPDLIPIVSVLAVFAEGESTIYGVDRLKFKESDRLSGIICILNSLKIKTEVCEKFVKVSGSKRLLSLAQNVDNQIFNSKKDHRLAMASSILAQNLCTAKIVDAQSIDKSYPNFYKDFQSLGGQIEEI